MRGELPAIAQSRAREELGLQVEGDAIVIIGDTPADIACGAGVDARAIGVATGAYSVADLAATVGETDLVVHQLLRLTLGQRVDVAAA